VIIYIPTLNRTRKQITYMNLPSVIQKMVVFVANVEDTTMLKHKFPEAKFMTCNKKGIGKTRQHIIENHDYKNSGPQICMLDDDLKFFVRRAEDISKFQPATEDEIIAMFNEIATQLLDYALVSVMTREGGNRATENSINTRCLRVLAYDGSILIKEKIKFDRLPVMEDFDVALQLLRKGYQNINLFAWVQDQGGSNTEGGCSTYRSMEVQAEGANGLKALHPKFVTAKEKETKVAWGGQKRTDVMVYWKKALNADR
jgi:hypothetical protein